MSKVSFKEFDKKLADFFDKMSKEQLQCFILAFFAIVKESSKFMEKLGVLNEFSNTDDLFLEVAFCLYNDLIELENKIKRGEKID